MNNKPVGYSHLHDFIATATTLEKFNLVAKEK
jgi:hypothetical protein